MSCHFISLLENIFWFFPAFIPMFFVAAFFFEKQKNQQNFIAHAESCLGFISINEITYVG